LSLILLVVSMIWGKKETEVALSLRNELKGVPKNGSIA